MKNAQQCYSGTRQILKKRGTTTKSKKNCKIALVRIFTVTSIFWIYLLDYRLQPIVGRMLILINLWISQSHRIRYWVLSTELVCIEVTLSMAYVEPCHSNNLEW